jgi:hypothetical protein
MAVNAANRAMEQAGIGPTDVDALIVACSNMQRPYPAIAVEVQAALGTRGYAFDMNVACSSATFGISTVRDMIAAGSVKRALVVSPEICTGHLNFRDRESHFIFGDACTAVVVERLEGTSATEPFEILGTRLVTRFSNAIRNDFGFLNRAAPEGRDLPNKLFVQQGRKVFKEVSPLVAELVSGHLDSLAISPSQVKRLWLHQANGTMNDWIAKKVLGREVAAEDADQPREQPPRVFAVHRADEGSDIHGPRSVAPLGPPYIAMIGRTSMEPIVADGIRAAMARATAFVLPCVVAPDGDQDGIPLVILEAMAAGLPVVTTPVSGIPELVDDEVGWLVPPGDVDALRSVLLEILENPEEALQRGRRGRERLRAMGRSLEAQVQGMLGLWGRP